MGMFDYVNYWAPCPHCLRALKDWQTKEKDCALEALEPDTVTEFYAFCDCGAFVTMNIDQHEPRAQVLDRIFKDRRSRIKKWIPVQDKRVRH